LADAFKALAADALRRKLAENAKEISDLGKELYKRLANMGDHLAKVGKSLGGATEAYNNHHEYHADRSR